MNSYRMVNRRLYTLQETFRTKRAASKRARQWREYRYMARIEKYNGRWRVYVSNSQSKKKR